MDADSLDTILALIKQMEATLIGLRQLRGYVGHGVGEHNAAGAYRRNGKRLV
jgi:hypothetical protein